MGKEFERQVTSEELKVLEQQFAKEGKHVTVQTKFNYAYGLIMTKEDEKIKHGITLIADIYTNHPERRRECRYFLALGYYKIGKFKEARDWNQKMLELEPNNTQALELDKAIKDTVSSDGIVGLTIVGGLAVVGAALVAALVKRSK